MRASHFFLSTLRETPKDATIASHRLMLRACMVQQIASGIYAWLPLGLKVLKKIQTIIHEEQERIGALEMMAPTIQPASLWQESGRYSDYGEELLRLSDRHKHPLLYGPTAEEVFTVIFKTHINSYRDLPHCLYNIQWKFRDEIRPRFGVMRGREFLMKDGYSFDLTAQEAHRTYGRIFQSYMKSFRRMGLEVLPVRASTGPIGGDLSHEFHVIADTGESSVFYDEKLHQGLREKREDFEGIYAMADDQHVPSRCPISPENLKSKRGIEVGHIFYFGTKYSVPLKALVSMPSGEKMPVEMGSYGIGVSRLPGAIIEAFHDDKGICWPLPVAPYPVSLCSLSKKGSQMAEKVYNILSSSGMDPFFYDLPKSAGDIFNDLDLIGFPYQVCIGDVWEKTEKLEIKERKTGEKMYFTLDEALSYLETAFQKAGMTRRQTLYTSFSPC